MKKILSTLLIFSLILVMLVMASCEGGNTDGGADTNGGKNEAVQGDSEKLTLVALKDIAEYSIVRSDNAGQGEKDVAIKLRDLIKEKFSVELPLKTDFGKDHGKEILIGDTVRAASKDAASDIDSYSEYLIRVSDNKIAIAAGSDEALMNAVEFWVGRMVNKDGELCVPKNASGYFNHSTAKFQKLTIDSVPLMDFAIYNVDSALSGAVSDLIDLFFEYGDVKLESGSGMNKSPNMIIFGTDAQDTKKSSVEFKDGNVYVTCSYYDTDWVVEYFKGIFDAEDKDNFNFTSSLNSEAVADVTPLYDKNDLMQVLEKVYNSEQIIVGTEMSNSINVVENTLKNYYEKSGEYPGILGLDVRYVNLHRLGEQGIAKVTADLTAYASQGGIVTASAHFSNPHDGDPTIENYRGTLGGDSVWAELVTEGTALNTTFKKELEGIADFFTILRDNGVPVIWRPLHETNGNWFWFCMVQSVNGYTVKVSEESFRNLWIYIHDYFTIERGLDNLLWEFGPNIGNEDAYMTAPLYGYPGDAYVDLVGFDWYTGDGDAGVLDSTPTYKDLKSLGKIININEFGPGGGIVAGEDQKQEDLFSCRNILGIFEEMRRGGYKIGYFLTWTANISIPELGHSDEFMANEITLGQAEVKALFEELK